MAQWSNRDASSNSALWAPTGFNLPANTTNRDALYGNTTPNAFTTGETIGMFGVDTTEMSVSNGAVIQTILVFGGSGYSANAAVTVTEPAVGSGFLANAAVSATGRISEIKISAAGSGYSGLPPTFVVAAPTLQIFNGNTAVSANAITITNANSIFLVGDKVRYASNATSLPVGLADSTDYFISFSNTTVVKLAATLGGANLTISSAPYASAQAGGATLRGETATGVAVVSGSRHGAHHAGWVIRTVGSGGRAGRVQYETLVAMGSMTQDGEDTVFPDA
jgi:hypothetical protein